MLSAMLRNSQAKCSDKLHCEAHLEILSHDKQDVLGSLEGLRFGDASYKHATRHRQVEGVVGSLEGHNAHVVVDGELGQIL